MSKLIIANWKMHRPDLAGWVAKVTPAQVAGEADVVVCAPFTLLTAATILLDYTDISLGAQDCHAEDEGAFTGDVSARMLAMAGCEYVIVGHSERRAYYGETDAQVKAKAQAAIKHKLIPIICIGESLEDYEKGETLKVLERQVKASVPPQDAHMVIAYEPVWAIGSGRTPTTEEIVRAHVHIKKQLEVPWPVVYGGSVKPANAGEILGLEAVDGVLVGSASLSGDDFAAIVKAVK